MKLAAELTQVGSGRGQVGGVAGCDPAGLRPCNLARMLLRLLHLQTAKSTSSLALRTLLPQSKRNTVDEEAPPAEQPQQGKAAPGGKAGKRGSGGQGGKAGGAPPVQFDALERQINEALVRLSLSEEQVAASLRQAQGAAAVGPAPQEAQPLASLPGERQGVQGGGGIGWGATAVHHLHGCAAEAPLRGPCTLPSVNPAPRLLETPCCLLEASRPTLHCFPPAVAQSVDVNGYRLDFHALLGSPSPDSMLPLSGGARRCWAVAAAAELPAAAQPLSLHAAMDS